LLRYLPTIFTTLLILVAVLLPGSKLPDVDMVGIDKVVHFGLFFIWALALRFDFGARFRWPWALVAGLAFTVATEVFQIVVDGRTFDVWDIVFDSLGLAVGIGLGPFVLTLLQKGWPASRKRG
jgi:VanZ family protein